MATKAGHVLPVDDKLADGSWISRLRKFDTPSHRMADTGVPVRVIDYGIDDPGRPQAEDRYRLITTILDPGAAPAAERPAPAHQLLPGALGEAEVQAAQDISRRSANGGTG